MGLQCIRLYSQRELPEPAFITRVVKEERREVQHQGFTMCEEGSSHKLCWVPGRQRPGALPDKAKPGRRQPCFRRAGQGRHSRGGRWRAGKSCSRCLGSGWLWLHCNLLQAATIAGVNIFTGTILFRLWSGIGTLLSLPAHLASSQRQCPLWFFLCWHLLGCAHGVPS